MTSNLTYALGVALIVAISILPGFAHASPEAKCQHFAQTWSELSVVAERGDTAAFQDAVLTYPHIKLREALNMAVSFEVIRYSINPNNGGLGEDRENTYRECVRFIKEEEK